MEHLAPFWLVCLLATVAGVGLSLGAWDREVREQLKAVGFAVASTMLVCGFFAVLPAVSPEIASAFGASARGSDRVPWSTVVRTPSFALGIAGGAALATSLASWIRSAFFRRRTASVG